MNFCVYQTYLYKIAIMYFFFIILLFFLIKGLIELKKLNNIGKDNEEDCNKDDE